MTMNEILNMSLKEFEEISISPLASPPSFFHEEKELIYLSSLGEPPMNSNNKTKLEQALKKIQDLINSGLYPEDIKAIKIAIAELDRDFLIDHLKNI